MASTTYNQVVMDTMAAETLNSNTARFKALINAGFSVKEILVLARSMRFSVNAALEAALLMEINQDQDQGNDDPFPFSLN